MSRKVKQKAEVLILFFFCFYCTEKCRNHSSFPSFLPSTGNRSKRTMWPGLLRLLLPIAWASCALPAAAAQQFSPEVSLLGKRCPQPAGPGRSLCLAPDEPGLLAGGRGREGGGEGRRVCPPGPARISPGSRVGFRGFHSSLACFFPFFLSSFLFCPPPLFSAIFVSNFLSFLLVCLSFSLPASSLPFLCFSFLLFWLPFLPSFSFLLFHLPFLLSCLPFLVFLLPFLPSFLSSSLPSFLSFFSFLLFFLRF